MPSPEEVREEASEKEPEVLNHFKDFPVDFLQSVQDILLENGVDIGDLDQVNGFDPAKLEQALRVKGMSMQLAQQYRIAMEKMMAQRIEQERQMKLELALKMKVKIARWQCAICGRPFCQVAPYIEGYDEIDA